MFRTFSSATLFLLFCLPAMAEEVTRQKAGGGVYGATGAPSAHFGPAPVALNRTA